MYFSYYSMFKFFSTICKYETHFQLEGNAKIAFNLTWLGGTWFADILYTL